MKRIKRLIITTFMILAIVAPAVMVLEGTSITTYAKSAKLSKKKATLKVGNSMTLKLRNCKHKIKWTSSNSKIVKVNARGKIFAKGAGTAKIKAKVGKSNYTCKVKVNFKDISLTTGQKSKLKVNGINASKVAWSSSNKSIVTVRNGKITAKAVGTSIITAKVGKNKYKAKINVRKKQPEWKSNFTLDEVVDTPDGLLIKATSLKAIKNVMAKVDYYNSNGKLVSYNCNDQVFCVASGETFYLTIPHPIGESYSSWKINFIIYNLPGEYKSQKSSLSLFNQWKKDNYEGVSVRNSSNNKITFDLITIYKYKGKIVGFYKDIMRDIEAKSVKSYDHLISTKGSVFDETEFVITDTALSD
ncbi:Ig-like domain-containing protein [Anaerosacchariphilus polymeriproducens]|nr:Ig-like domain-containing protein [Anaerosacchariphilus polymeriproducens]